MDVGDPPLFLMVIPPFGIGWIDRMEEIGAVPASENTRRRLSELDANGRRDFAWEAVATVEQEAEDAGCAGVILAGLKKETLLSEAAHRWRSHTA